ncbi:MAG: hypothetical protein ACQKBU_09460, partial [Verrucomicrobiales bacterium]
GCTLVTCLLLGRKIWMLLPLLGGLQLSFAVMGQPSTLLIGQFLFCGFTVLLLLTRQLPFRLQFTEMEFWLLIVILAVVQVFARNPVGLNILGSSSVGAKPYAIFFITAFTGVFMSGYQFKSADLKWIFRLSVIGGILNFFIMLFGTLVPTVGVYFKAASGASEAAAATHDPEAAGRIPFLGTSGRNFALWVNSRLSPLATLVRPHWGFLLFIALLFAGLSGYRNHIAWVALICFFGLLYHGGFTHLVTSSIMGVLALTLLALVNLTYPLPPNIQRALSFLPGTWESSIVQDAKNSTDWRVEIWKEVLLTDNWITNKYLGDGLGFSRKELNLQLSLMEAQRYGITTGFRSISGFDLHRESILANGDYHSGPVQTVRTIGYIGLALMLFAMIRLAVHSHRLILRYRGTEWQPLCLFVGLPLIINPIFFTFVFGTFQSQAVILCMGIGYIRMLENNLPSNTTEASATASAATAS